MTPELAAFVNELRERAVSSVDGSLLKRAATLLIGDDEASFLAHVAVAAARREAERLDLTPEHRAEAERALAVAVAHHDTIHPTPKEETDGRDEARHAGPSAAPAPDAEKARPKARHAKHTGR